MYWQHNTSKVCIRTFCRVHKSRHGDFGNIFFFRTVRRAQRSEKKLSERTLAWEDGQCKVFVAELIFCPALNCPYVFGEDADHAGDGAPNWSCMDYR